MKRLVAALTICLLAALPARADSAFAPGQMWSVKNSPAKVIVVKVEPWHERTVVHVSIIDISAPADMTWLDHVGHMPFDQDALAQSVDQLVGKDALASHGFDEGYARWKADNGGIFTISVPEAIGLMIETARRGMPK